MSDQYKCKNCGHRAVKDYTGMGEPQCRKCNVSTMGLMHREICPNCSGEKLIVHSPEKGRPEPTAECVDCGRTANVDADGLWW